jgi:hypothetical protein
MKTAIEVNYAALGIPLNVIDADPSVSTVTAAVASVRGLADR